MKKAERAYLARVSEGGCIVCSLFHSAESGRCEIHHVRTGMGSKRASNFEVIGLCPEHHRNGGYGVALHAGRQEFERNYASERELLSHYGVK